MKKILALAALFAVAPAFAAHNEFTFNVNSSGANMYVCGVRINYDQADVNSGLTADAVDPSNSMSYDLYTMDEWDGQPIHEPQHVVFSHNSYMYPRIEFDDVLNTGTYREIRNLVINLGSEKYGVKYEVDVCYNIPHFMDMSKVAFDIDAAVEFENRFNKNYLDADHGNVKAELKVQISQLEDGGLSGTFQERTFQNLLDGRATTNLKLDLPWGTSEDFGRIIVATYKFSENSSARRPHVAHGGQFTLDTTVTPVANPASN